MHELWLRVPAQAYCCRKNAATKCASILDKHYDHTVAGNNSKQSSMPFMHPRHKHSPRCWAAAAADESPPAAAALACGAALLLSRASAPAPAADDADEVSAGLTGTATAVQLWAPWRPRAGPRTRAVHFSSAMSKPAVLLWVQSAHTKHTHLLAGCAGQVVESCAWLCAGCA